MVHKIPQKPIVTVAGAESGIQPSDQESFAQLDVAGVFAKPFRPLKLADQIDALVTKI